METLFRADSLLVIGILVFLVSRWRSSRSKHSLAPGPSRWPILGNALQLPDTNNRPWLTYSHWAQKYGDIIYLEAMRQPIVLVSSVKIAKDLMEKRSSIYSDRPQFVMAGELTSYTEMFVLQPYGKKWRKQRKYVTQALGQTAVSAFYDSQEKEARKFVSNVLHDTSRLKKELELRIGTIIISATYGYYLKDENDPFLRRPITTMENFAKVTAPGAWLVDFVPQLRYLPKWMPGAGFLKTADKWRKHVLESSYTPFRWAQEKYENQSEYCARSEGTISSAPVPPNLCSTIFTTSSDRLSQEDEEQLIWAAASIMGGGLDTNVSTVLTFLLAMSLHPDVQAKAQAEVDSVVGSDRLPDIADRDSMPYLRSVMTEVFRWKPTAPLGLPHALSVDDVYEGYHLPKGTLVIPNVWHMLHDPSVYENPGDFNPDRYRNSDEEMQKVSDLIFGFGRRRCPGISFAEGSFFAIAATLLATCEMTSALDSEGKKIIGSDLDYTASGTIIFPKPFQCTLKSRSKQSLSLLSCYAATA